MCFCLVRTDSSGKKQEGISFLLIDMNSPGIEVKPIITIDGESCSNTWADGCGEIPPPANFTSESTLYELCPNECPGILGNF